MIELNKNIYLGWEVWILFFFDHDSIIEIPSIQLLQIKFPYLLVTHKDSLDIKSYYPTKHRKKLYIIQLKENHTFKVVFATISKKSTKI